MKAIIVKISDTDSVGSVLVFKDNAECIEIFKKICLNSYDLILIENRKDFYQYKDYIFVDPLDIDEDIALQYNGPGLYRMFELEKSIYNLKALGENSDSIELVNYTEIEKIKSISKSIKFDFTDINYN